MHRLSALVFTVLIFGGALSGCLAKKGVSITGDEKQVVIRSQGGYDALAVARGHCGSYKRKAIFAGRSEAAGQDIISIFNCMLR